MDASVRRQSVARHRERLRRRGFVRLELSVRPEDASLLRQVASALASDEQRDDVRILLEPRFGAARPVNLKALLASAPLDGVDLSRPRDLGRAVDL